MKKIARILGVVFLTLCLASSLVACGKDKGKIGVVAISDESYADAEAALKGYLANEISYSYEWDGHKEEIIRADYVSHESKGEVKADKIAFTDAQKTDLVSVEKFKVKATLVFDPSVNSEDELKKEDIEQTVYVLKYGEAKFNYMVGDPVVGECATNSYVESLKKNPAYRNCEITTVERTTGEQRGKKGGELKFIDACITTIASNVIHRISFEDETRFNSKTPGHGDLEEDFESYDIEDYFVLKDNKPYSVSKRHNGDDSEWDVSTMREELNTFEKAVDYLVEENLFGIFDEICPANFKITSTGAVYSYSNDEDGDVGIITVTVKISDGKITSVLWEESGNWMDGDVKVFEENYMEATVTYGSASVTVPADVTAAVETYVTED